MNEKGAPLVSVVLAVHNGAPYVLTAVTSVLRQTLADLELVVVDDGSTDETATLLAGVDDSRLAVLTIQERSGLATALNHGLDRARGRYVARLDADDIALPEWLERLVARIREEAGIAIVGTAMLDVDESLVPDGIHRLPSGPNAVRWHALFSSPFFHSTVLLDRGVLDGNHLRYDPSFLESEDYDLWARLLALADGDNVAEPLVLHRVHGGQASQRRRGLQTTHQRDVALREIARVAPELEGAELAWELGSGRLPADPPRAARSYLALLEAFEARRGVDPEVRETVARRLARGGRFVAAARVVPTFPARIALERARRARETRSARARAVDWLAQLATGAVSVRVTVVSPEPTPYRAPLFDLVAARPEIDLTVVYAAPTVVGRTWAVSPQHRAVFLRGLRVPGARRLLRHDYPVTPGIVRALKDARPDVVVVSGWSTFASQAAVAWCRARRVPYVVLVESHDVGPRGSWRRAIKSAVVPRIVRDAAGVLVVGSLARESVVARGSAPDRVRVFANTIDVPAWIERAEHLSAGDHGEDVVVLSAGRLVVEKGFDVLIRAIAETADERLHLVLAGAGPRGSDLLDLAASLGVWLTLRGDLSEQALAAEYANADVFALLSTYEPWGVVVNEAAASGLPLVLSDRVGAAHDLLRDGENGSLVPVGDVGAAAQALRRLADDAGLRRRFGERSRELVRRWSYEPSVENFVAAVREAAASR